MCSCDGQLGDSNDKGGSRLCPDDTFPGKYTIAGVTSADEGRAENTGRDSGVGTENTVDQASAA